MKKRVESVQISREACFRWLEEGDASGLSMAVSVAVSGGDGDGTSSDTSYGTMTQALVYQMTRRVCVYVFIRPLTRVH